MSYVLLNRKQGGSPEILARYSSRKGALIGMRSANKNAGWTRITRCASALTDMEWCARSNGLPEYDYGPYVVMAEIHYNQKYRINLCEVA
jgi:hypothetical protein